MSPRTTALQGTMRNHKEKENYLSPDDGSRDNSNDGCAILHQDSDASDSKQKQRLIERSRERNRLHARQTRLRKKAKLETLRLSVRELRAQGRELRQTLEDCRTASILACLSSSPVSASSSSSTCSGASENSSFSSHIHSLLLTATNNEDQMDEDLKLDDLLLLDDENTQHQMSAASHLKRTQLSQLLTLVVDGQTIYFGGGHNHLNWKTGAYRSLTDTSSKQLSSEQLKSLRRQRNRLHAKTTRDRKKSHISALEKAIEDLESKNRHMMNILFKVAQTSTNFKLHSSCSSTKTTTTTTTTSPEEVQ